jgi:4-hydroxybenzoate polyprenyltransferase
MTASPQEMAGAEALPARGGVLGGLVRSLRPGQWVKNSVVFAALIFARRFADPDSVLRAASGFLLFCGASGAVYLFNDLLDARADRAHPAKARRPIASGQVPPAAAAAASAVLASACLAAAWGLSPPLATILAIYVAINLLYSTWLKRVVILDVMAVASGFLLRAVAGAAVLEVEISHWLILCASLLSLFLGFCKRRAELQTLAGGAARHRTILEEYSFPFLDQMISVVTASTVVAYCLYTLDPAVQAKLATHWLPLTIPFVLYGIFRYLYLVYRRDEGGSPTRALYADPPLLVDVALWAASAVALVGAAG